jgi:membrane-bound lytic murein transglycosylase B
MDYGISTNISIADNIKAKLLMYELEKSEEYWLGLKNFYVITRYNHSALYAMAVFQLSQEMIINAGE